MSKTHGLVFALWVSIAFAGNAFAFKFAAIGTPGLAKSRSTLSWAQAVCEAPTTSYSTLVVHDFEERCLREASVFIEKHRLKESLDPYSRRDMADLVGMAVHLCQLPTGTLTSFPFDWKTIRRTCMRNFAAQQVSQGPFLRELAQNITRCPRLGPDPTLDTPPDAEPELFCLESRYLVTRGSILFGKEDDVSPASVPTSITDGAIESSRPASGGPSAPLGADAQKTKEAMATVPQ